MSYKREIKRVVLWSELDCNDVIFEMTNGWYYYVKKKLPGKVYAMDNPDRLLRFDPYFTCEGEIPADKLEAAKKAVLTGEIVDVMGSRGAHPEK